MLHSSFVRHQYAFAALLVLAGAACAAPPAASVNEHKLLQTASSWDGVPYRSYPQGQPQISIVKITIPPHTALKWHRHAMPNAAYISAGEIMVEKLSDGRKKLFRQGETIAEIVGDTHRGRTGEQAAELVVFYAGVPGLPLSEEVQVP